MPRLAGNTHDDLPDAPAPEASPANRRRLVALLPTLGIFLGLAAGALALVLFVVRPLFPPVAGGTAKGPAAAPRFGRVLALDAVVVNVAQTEGRRYLKTTIQLEVPEEEKAVKEVEGRKAQLLDLLIAILAKKSLAELSAPDALERLRAEVHERLSQELGREKVRRVFITEFVIQ
jgi:flagellar FliL protein